METIVDEPRFRNRVYVFQNRFHAGELLSQKMREFESSKDSIILAIPAGGIQVAYVVSERLQLPLDVAITRKLHIPWNREAGFGAISWDGLMFLNEPLVASIGLKKEDIDRCISEEKEVIKRRLERYRGNSPYPNLENKTVIIIDDGLASGFSMLTTLKTLKHRNVKESIVAVPTSPESAIRLIEPYSDLIICLNIRSGPYFAVADAYKVWYDLEDEEVIDILSKSNFYLKSN